MTRRALRGVLAGFLGTYVSRHSDHRGYWVFGQLDDADRRNMVVDLLAPAPEIDSPRTAARALAVRRFAEQLARHGLTRDVVAHAELRLTGTDEFADCWHGRERSRARRLLFRATVRSDLGAVYEADCSTLVAPHDPTKEGRRHEEQWGP